MSSPHRCLLFRSGWIDRDHDASADAGYRFDDALTGLADTYRALLTSESRDPAVYEGFLQVLARDAESSLAGLRLVMAQADISSQLVDNLNASIHIRALLTDVFLIDELLKQQ